MSRNKKITEPLEIPEVQFIKENEAIIESKENMAKQEVKENTEMQEINVSFETESKVFKNPNDILFCVKYPKEYKGSKYMPEGEVVISKESAEIFIKKGIGKIIN